MEIFKNKRILVSLIVIWTILFAGSTTYSILREEDPYKFFNGLGSDFYLSPDDQHFIFSYFLDGKEAIYTADIQGKNVMKVTSPESERHNSPKYSHNGEKILFLSQNSERINSLYVANRDGSGQKPLTSKEFHVSEAVFSLKDDKIYYTGIEAEDFKKAEGETKEGFDLYVIDTSGHNPQQFTNKDHFNMNTLSLSPDGKKLYYSLFDGISEKLTYYSVENGDESEAIIPKRNPSDGWYFQLSPDDRKMAYTAVSEESKNSSLYEYELFLMDLKNGETKRLTDLNSSISSPRFFHHKNEIAFLHNTNWPNDPAEFSLYTQNLDTKKLHSIKLSLPEPETNHWFKEAVYMLGNKGTIAFLYTILLGLFTFYQYNFHPKKIFLPALTSLCLAAAVFISSIGVAATYNPWYGIALGMVAAAILGCTIVVFVFGFVLKWVTKTRH